MKLNEKGQDLYNRWEQFYHAENDLQGGNYAKGEIVEGWSIIEYRAQTLEEICGLMIYGYDDGAPAVVAEWIQDWGKDHKIWNGFTCGEINNALMKYYEKIDFCDDAEKMRDFRALSKEDFLESYSYLTEEEYNATERLDRGAKGGRIRSVKRKKANT